MWILFSVLCRTAHPPDRSKSSGTAVSASFPIEKAQLLIRVFFSIENYCEQGCIPVGCVPPALYRTGESLSGGPLSGGSLSGGSLLPSPCGQTDVCENITLPQTLFAGGNDDGRLLFWVWPFVRVWSHAWFLVVLLQQIFGSPRTSMTNHYCISSNNSMLMHLEAVCISPLHAATWAFIYPVILFPDPVRQVRNRKT